MKTLHILRKRKDVFAEAAICSELASSSASGGSGAGEGHGVTVLLIQDAVLGRPAVPVPVYVNGDDLLARGAMRPYAASDQWPVTSGQRPHKPPHIINYEQICRMILDHDRTVVW